MSIFKFLKRGGKKPSKPYSNYLHIEPIDRETIDFADDFFFKLSDKQVYDKIIELQKKQQYIYIMLNTFLKDFRGTKQQYVLFRIALAIDYCYNKFYNEIPFITQKKVVDFSTFVAEDHEADIARGELKMDTDKILRELNQPYLIEMVALKQMLYHEDLNILNEKESHAIGQFMTFIIPIYSEEVIINH
jgi:hypothetical protein